MNCARGSCRTVTLRRLPGASATHSYNEKLSIGANESGNQSSAISAEAVAL